MLYMALVDIVDIIVGIFVLWIVRDC